MPATLHGLYLDLLGFQLDRRTRINQAVTKLTLALLEHFPAPAPPMAQGAGAARGIITLHAYPTAPEDAEWDAGDGADKGDYKLPHHKADGYATVWRGVAAAMEALLGVRGGVSIPGSDKRGVYNHLVGH